jgi:hypothetical protein
MVQGPLARSVLLVLVVAGLAGCSASAQLSSGSIAGGDWSMQVSRDTMSGTCLEIRATGRASQRICGLTPDDLTWIPDAPPGESSFVAGTVGSPQVVTVRAELGDGTTLAAQPRVANVVSPLRFYVVVLPPGSTLTRLDLLDADGLLVTSLPGP